MLRSPDATDQTSSSLLQRIRNPDDMDSWLTFEMVYAPVIRSYCYRQRFQEADVEDVVQEVMLMVARYIPTFDYHRERGRFRAWLGVVTANVMKNYSSKRSNRPMAPLSCDTTDVADPDSDWVAIFSERIFRVACDRVRDRFDLKTWQTFELNWLEHVPVQEVAERLEIPVHSVYVNKSRVLKKLEEEVRLLADDVSVMHQE